MNILLGCKNNYLIIFASNDKKRANVFLYLLFPRSFLSFSFYHAVGRLLITASIVETYRIEPKKIEEKFSTHLDRKIIHRLEAKTTPTSIFSNTVVIFASNEKTNEFNFFLRKYTLVDT